MNYTAIVNPIAINQGADFSQEITLSPVVDLTGWVGTCHIRASASLSSPVLATGTVTLNVDPTLGIFTLSFTGDQTKLLPTPTANFYNQSVTYTYDVKFTKTTETFRAIQGMVTVSPQVTY